MKSSEKVRIPTASLLKSGVLGDYQQDFAKAILTKPEYTIDEAKEALDKVLKRKKEDK